MAENKGKGNKSVKKKEQATADSEEAVQTISLFLAIGLIIGSLIVGLVVGYLVAPKGTALNNTNQTAPTLTPDQVNSGQLPPGHPKLPSGQSGETSSTSGTSNTTGGAATSTP